MSKIAVVFPGVGYNKDRPLLYYAGKAASACGFELKHIDFSGIEWSKEKLKDRDFLLKTLDICIKKAEDALTAQGDMSGDELVFISKSIGTVVATAYSFRKSLNVRHICFSPLEFINEYVSEKSAILFYGDNDPYADHKSIEKIARDKELEMYKISGGNHSLETGDVSTDIDNLKGMIRRVTDVINDGTLLNPSSK